MTTRMHLTQAERDLIVELCYAAKLHKKHEHDSAQESYDMMDREGWERVESIIVKLETPDPDLQFHPAPERT